MATAPNVIQPPGNPNVTAENAIDWIETRPVFRLLKGEDLQAEKKADKVDIEELYPVVEVIRSELSIALGLLNHALDYLREAYDANQKGNDIASDDAIQRFQSLLPELFNCRAIGDGYGAIINALLSSLENMQGTPLNQQQIQTILQVIYRLRQEPYIQFSDAMDEVDKLEEANFTIEPEGFDVLVDWLNG